MEFVSDISISIILIRLLVSLVIGIALGIEREIRHKTIGLRDTVLICIGSTVFTLVSVYVSTGSSSADPSRIAAQILTGIGFIGAGSIIRTRGSVHGLTTAATIWVVAALGMAVGFGNFWIGGFGAALVIIVLNPFKKIVRAVKGKKTARYTLKLSDTGPAIDVVMNAVQKGAGEVRGMRVSRKGDMQELSFGFTDGYEKHTRLMNKLTRTDGVVEVSTDQPMDNQSGKPNS